MIRSFLYVPVSSERFVAKAHERGADAIILDLEDGVAPAEKERARDALKDAAKSASQNGAKIFVRTNGPGAHGLADAEAACRAGAFGIFLAKAQTPADIASLDDRLTQTESTIASRPPTRIVPMIEDPNAVLDARPLALASKRNFALVTGSEDLATCYGAEPTPALLRLPKLMVHMAAKATGLYSFGLLRTIADYADREAIVAAAAESRALGFDGASCVHPTVVPILNAAFSPTPEDIEKARRMIAAFDKALADGNGAFVFDGKMVDKPVVDRARGLLARV